MKYIKTFEEFVNESKVNEAAAPTHLYHATYQELVSSIKKDGLDDDKGEGGVVYFGMNPKVAKDWALKDNDKASDVVFKVAVSDLDADKLKAGSAKMTYEYDGDIPWKKMTKM